MIRKHSIGFLVLAGCLGLFPLRAAGEDGSWVGKKVMPTKNNIKIGYTDENDQERIVATLTDIIYTVEKEQGEFIKVRHNGVAGWFAKKDAVLLENAITYFTARIRQNEKDAFAYAYRGWAWKEKGEYEIAIKDYGEAIRLEPDEQDWFNNRGLIRYDMKDYEGAIKDYTEAIRIDPKNVNAFNNRGVAWSDKQDYDRAIKDYNEAIRLDPKYASAFCNRGFAWYNKKDYTRAIKDYDEATRLDPTFALAFNNRGLTRYDKKDYDRAIKDYDEAIRLDPQFALPFNNRGNAWRAKKNYDRAIKDHDEAIRLDPKYAWAFNDRGFTWFSKKNFDRAIKDYDEAIRLDPKHVYAHFNRAVAQMMMRQNEAIGGFRSVIDLQGWKGDRSSYAIILGYFAGRQMGDEAAAKRLLTNSAGKLDQAWPYPAVKYLRREIDGATLLKLADDDDKRTEAHCFLGLDCALKNHKDEAQAHYRWVKEHGNPDFTEYVIAVAEWEQLQRPPASLKR